jgi:hypothetical protein
LPVTLVFRVATKWLCTERRNSVQKRTIVTTLLVMGFAALAPAQMSNDKSQRPSPPAQAQCTFSDGKTITVDYSSPRAKGRTIFGSLVPYGEVWRTGANEATTFVTTANLKAGTLAVPAGSYTIFTIPKPDKWTLIINRKTGEWGIPYKYESDELGRVEMKVSQSPSLVENFTIAFDQKGHTCAMNLSWEKITATAEFSEAK